MEPKKKNYLKNLFFIALIVINLTLCSWYVLHKDILFFTDIARDFLLLEEIDHKHIVFLGPRSSTSGLFHGPLWLYVNYPAYVIGHGDPLIVGWFWILLITTFLLTGFIFAKKLFDQTTAYLFTILMSTYLIFQARGLFNPHGALFLMPAFFFFFIRFVQTRKLKFLIIFLFLAGCIIQFQMAIGIPLLLLATVPIIYQLVKHKKKTYFLSFFVLLIPLSTFIVFDASHHFFQLKSVMAYLFNDNLDQKTYTNFFGLLINRIHLIFAEGLGIFIDGSGYKSQLAALMMIVFLFIQIKNNKYKTIYLSFLYFYIGYFSLSLINKSGGMLTHYYMPLYALTYLIFASFITSHYKKVFIAGFIIVYYLNMIMARNFIDASQSFFGKNPESWQAIFPVAQKVYQGPEKTFGYFIYMPDMLAYQPKYALAYAKRLSDKKTYSFQKQPITYLVIAPPPPDKPGMKDEWWVANQVKIAKKPISTMTFPNGYKIEKYNLSDKEMQVPFDPTIDTGIHFR